MLGTCIVISFYLNRPIVWPAYCTAPMTCEAAEKVRQQIVPNDDYPAWKLKHSDVTGPVVMQSDHPNYSGAVNGRVDDLSAWKHDHQDVPLPFGDKVTTVSVPPCQPFPAG